MKSSKVSEVHFFTQGLAVPLRERTRLKSYLKTILNKEGHRLGFLNFIFCTDKALLEINRTYLQHDYYTDIITFDYTEKKGPVKGEIYISIDRVRDNAYHINESIKKELHRVIFHGVLHLCGYMDKKASDIRIMREKESYYLNKYFS